MSDEPIEPTPLAIHTLGWISGMISREVLSAPLFDHVLDASASKNGWEVALELSDGSVLSISFAVKRSEIYRHCQYCGELIYNDGTDGQQEWLTESGESAICVKRVGTGTTTHAPEEG